MEIPHVLNQLLFHPFHMEYGMAKVYPGVEAEAEAFNSCLNNPNLSNCFSFAKYFVVVRVAHIGILALNAFNIGTNALGLGLAFSATLLTGGYFTDTTDKTLKVAFYIFADILDLTLNALSIVSPEISYNYGMPFYGKCFAFLKLPNFYDRNPDSF